MSLAEIFKNYCNDIQNVEEEKRRWMNRLESIAKRLNKKYYDSTSEKDHMLVVGSVGRDTAIRGVSDWDCIFELPQNVYKRFNNYEINGQSALLQEIKKELQKLYSKTVIKGDGQVVVISFNDGVIELVPGFKQSDGNYKYPDSNEGGNWKITKPILEQDAAKIISDDTNYHYIYFCQLLRKWKNNIGFKFKGLLIDTLVKEFIDADETRKMVKFSDYSDCIVDLFDFLSKEDANRSYWYALGSNQKIYNDDNGKFIKKAKIYLNKLKKLDSEEAVIETYREIFGRDFAKENLKAQYTAPHEEFAENKFNVDIYYNLKLECIITQSGFRPKLLTEYLSKRWKLKANKQLEFKVSYTNIPESLLAKVTWYWKVRNTGYEAKKRNNERGQIVVGGMKKYEHTNFNGNHYVECYAVIQNTVVAKARINVPINIVNGVD